MADWNAEELRAAIGAYLTMLGAQERGEKYSKADFRRALRKGPLKARSEPSIEYRMRNISSVLDQHGRPTLKGYLPAANVGEKIRDAIWAAVREIDGSPIATGGTQSRSRTATSTAVTPQTQPKIIYFNVGWMKRYAGPAADDPTIGSHGYLDDHEHGAESFNFLATGKGLVRGYRPPGDRERTNLSRLGAPGSQQELKGVLVVWLAREPGTGRKVIAGWYRDATLYRNARDGGIEFNGELIHYTAEARAADAVLLPPAARTFQVKSSRVSPGEGFGQKPTWYGSPAVDKRVWAYVQSWLSGRAQKKPARKNKPPKNFDPELRRKVERAAVEHAISYYKSIYGADCPIESVETEAKGWDLEVFADAEPLLVEVKGLFKAALVCELTPNEYEKMMLRHNRSRYVVFVVNNALAEHPASPIASVFGHCGSRSWKTADGRELKIAEKVAAVLSAA
jgi:hypothetical protein